MTDSSLASSANPLIRQRSPAAEAALELEQPAKKAKIVVESSLEEEEAASGPVETDVVMEAASSSATPITEVATSDKPKLLAGAMLPPSSIIYSNPDGQLGLIASDDGLYHIRESDVGIIEYLSDKEKTMEGVIKQR